MKRKMDLTLFSLLHFAQKSVNVLVSKTSELLRSCNATVSVSFAHAIGMGIVTVPAIL